MAFSSACLAGDGNGDAAMVSKAKGLTLQWRSQGDVLASYVSTVAFSPDSRLVAVGTTLPNRAIVFAAETGQPLLRISEQDDPGGMVRFSLDGETLLTACDGGWTKAWSALDGRPLQSLHLPGPVLQMHVWVDPDTVVCQVGKESVEIWDWRIGRQLHVLNCSAPVADLAVAPAIGLVALALDRRAVYLWRPDSGSIATLTSGRTERLGAPAFAETGSLLAIGGKAMVEVWDTQRGQSVRDLPLYGERYGSINALAFQPSGTLLAAGMFRGNHPIVVWDVATSALVQQLDEADPIVNEVAFSPNGRLLAAASDDYGVGLSVWNVIST